MSRMFFRMLFRPLIVRRGSSAIAVLAIVVAVTAATAMLTLFTDVQAKLRGEFRSYGANILVTANSGDSLPPDTLQTIESQLGNTGIAAPFGYVVAKINGDSVVVAGLDVDRTKKVDPFWLATAWPRAGTALLGARASKQFGKGDWNSNSADTRCMFAPPEYCIPAALKTVAFTSRCPTSRPGPAFRRIRSR